MKIVIVDDNPLIWEGIKYILDRSDLKANVIGTASNASDLWDILTKKLPDIILLDITLKDRNGIDILYDIKKMYPDVPVLILSMHPERDFAIRAFKAGANGYLNKTVVHEELVKALITIVKHKKKYINAAAGEELVAELTGQSSSLPHKKLSDREYQVFTLIARGKKVSEIASILSISVQTIHSYRSRIKDKMRLDTNADFIRYAIKHHLVD